MNNAGVVNTHRKLSSDGIEETFAVNHLAYVLLTELLRERIVQSAATSICVATSPSLDTVSGEYFSDSKVKSVKA
jgi:retinol dehydrogenase-12